MRALLAGEEGLEDRGRLGDRRTECVRASGEQRHDGRGSRREHGVEELLLGARELERGGVAALAARASAEQAGTVAEGEHDDVGAPGRLDRGGNALALVAIHARAPLVHELAARELLAKRLEKGRELDAERDVRMQRSHVTREGVAAEHGVGIVGVGPDDGDATGSDEGEDPVVAQQHDRPLGQVPRERAILRAVEVDRAPDAAPAESVRPSRTRIHEVDAESGECCGDGRPLRVEQTELDLLGEDPAQRSVDEPLLDFAVGDGLEQGSAEGPQGGELDVDPGAQGGHGCFAPGPGDTVERLEEADGEIVGDDGACEPPGLAQQPGQQARVGRGGDAVEVGVGVHDRAGAAFAQGHLEGREEHIRELPRTDRDGGEVAAPVRGRVADEVLERRDDARRLESAHVGAADRSD